MKRYLVIILFTISFGAWSQEDTFAREYFKNGEFEKALFEYKKLYDKHPGNINYVLALVKTLRQLERYDESEGLLKQQIERVNYPAYYVELGYNYQLKNNMEKANENYNKAISTLTENVSHVYSVARYFEDYSLLDQAITTYEKAKELKPELNFEVQLARIYGDQGNIEKMFEAYLTFLEKNNAQLNTIKRNISEFISEDETNQNNAILKKLLLKKIQGTQNLLFNEMLSWLFVQQKDYKKAFAQERAIFNRQPESLSRIEELAQIAYDSGNLEVAKQIYTYLIDTAQDTDTILNANYKLLQLETENTEASQYSNIKEQYLALFNTYGTFQQTLDLQISYAHFLAFYLNNVSEATQFLKQSLNLPLTAFQETKVKMELGDILVLQEKFNEALIYYTQIQQKLKNSTISQEARFKVAQTSYFKGDFNWAESQLKILKSSTSQLIANDALDLKLLISDNSFEDSTQTALKLYAKADLLAYQNKTSQAITILNTILSDHKGESMEDQALFKQAQLFEKTKQYQKAKDNYTAIITNFKDDILADDAYYHLAELYANQLADPELAKQLYEEIIFNYSDSIYFVEAQKKYRTLRGDNIN